MLFPVKRRSSRRAKALAQPSAEQHPARKDTHRSMSKSPGLIWTVLVWSLPWKLQAGFLLAAACHGCTAAPSAPSLNWVLRKRARGRASGVRVHARTHWHSALPNGKFRKQWRKAGDLLFHTEFRSLGKTADAPASLGALDSIALYLSQQLSAIQGHTCKHKIYSTFKSQTSCLSLWLKQWKQHETRINLQWAILNSQNGQETKSLLLKRWVQFLVCLISHLNLQHIAMHITRWAVAVTNSK